jgi:hypothetical protein
MELEGGSTLHNIDAGSSSPLTFPNVDVARFED